ncbi:hypothetical protein BGZ61DRAFT_586662 [Ilyonectria robusta]|uniref:uncharacterized protein n=1 Tax=Ilyonectria robusta TaxID=1079257 RepID=UPI001E8EC8D2|nr:uncharacterized protein BGZ61DRAFT_586662 [Ilyonectria robusta]KAH8721974.1 hypothetical protein BGZ61DRAFT_586662 [Ilyonectria robusta]
MFVPCSTHVVAPSIKLSCFVTSALLVSVALTVSAAYQDKLVDAETRSFHLTETNKADVLTTLDEREIELRKPAQTPRCI